MKTKRFFLLLLGLPLVILLFMGGLNYSGMCIAEDRWLSDEERIEKEIRHIITSKQVYVPYGINGSKYYDKVDIHTVDKFLEQNPKCCKVASGESIDTPPPPFIDRITGHNYRRVIAEYPVKYQYRGKIYQDTVVTWRFYNDCGSLYKF